MGLLGFVVTAYTLWWLQVGERDFLIDNLLVGIHFIIEREVFQFRTSLGEDNIFLYITSLASWAGPTDY